MAKEFINKTIKELFPEYIVFIKIGNFYEVYEDDAIIISYLFGYKIRNINNLNSCGFPLNSINKVLSILDRKTINYIAIDKAHNYEEEVKENYKRKNNYNEILESAKNYIDKIDRIEKIRNHLMMDDSKLIDVERLIYE